MLQLSPILDADIAIAQRTPGGFCWWYADLVDADGNGLVLIWSFGLPFLPASNTKQIPAHRPSLSVSYYAAGRQLFYAFQHYPAELVSTDGAGRWQFADSWMSLSEQAGRGELEVSLKLAVPGSRTPCIGFLRMAGTLCKIADAGRSGARLGADNPHRWAPKLVACRGEAGLWHEDFACQLRGRAYLDGNVSSMPLGALGIARWRWGRLAFHNRELLYYLVESEHGAAAQQLMLVIDQTGTVAQHSLASVAIAHERRSRYGPRFPRQLRLRNRQGDLDIVVRRGDPVEQGPFYLRFISEAICQRTGESARGFSELLLPQRVGVPWHQPFVRMRCHALAGRNSMWLPWFTGPRRGRMARLLRAWLDGFRPTDARLGSKRSPDRLEASR